MINQQKICARDLQDKVDACQGDSGGPLMALELGSPGSLQGLSPENVLTYHPFFFLSTLIEKKIEFSSYIKKFRREPLQSHI
jgi:hypothetical protein